MLSLSKRFNFLVSVEISWKMKQLLTKQHFTGKALFFIWKYVFRWILAWNFFQFLRNFRCLYRSQWASIRFCYENVEKCYEICHKNVWNKTKRFFQFLKKLFFIYLERLLNLNIQALFHFKWYGHCNFGWIRIANISLWKLSPSFVSPECVSNGSSEMNWKHSLVIEYLKFQKKIIK